MEKGKAGAIVDVGSISAFGPSTRAPAYAAVKAALIGYTASQVAHGGLLDVQIRMTSPSAGSPGTTSARNSRPAASLQSASKTIIPAET